MKRSPWFPFRRKAADLLNRSGCQPGDILIRLGAAMVYGFLNFSNMIASATDSKYSHAAMILDVLPEIVIVDVSGEGLRRQYSQDWLTDIYSDDFLILRHKDQRRIDRAVEATMQAVHDDAGYDELFAKGWESLYCVEAVCLAYDESPMPIVGKMMLQRQVKFSGGRVFDQTICEAKPMNQLPGWKLWMAAAAKLHGINSATPIWFVGNGHQGILACKDLTLHRRVTLAELKKVGENQGA